MLQATKNKYCKETFLRLNNWYAREHGVAREDVEQVNRMVEHIEATRSDQVPQVGDGLVFISAYGDRSEEYLIDGRYGDCISVRRFPRIPLVSMDKDGIKYDTGGECILLKTNFIKFKAWTTGRFKQWGRVGKCQNGEVYYDARTGLWEYPEQGCPENRKWLKIHVRKDGEPDGDRYIGEFRYKDEEELRRFINDHEGFTFPDHDSQQTVVFCFRHLEQRLPPEEWEKVSLPITMREVCGLIREVKIAKNHENHRTTFYYTY
jgi:hypothetical protein